MKFLKKTMAQQTWRWWAFGGGAFRWPSGWRRSSSGLRRSRCRSGRSISRCIAMTFLPWIQNRSCRKVRLGSPVAGKSVVLVDDVLYTGRTTRAAMDALVSRGAAEAAAVVRADRSRASRVADRGAFIGRVVQTTENQIIEVKLREVDDAEKVLLMEKG